MTKLAPTRFEAALTPQPTTFKELTACFAHALQECFDEGVEARVDPAVRLLADRLGEAAAVTSENRTWLIGACEEAVAADRARPLLVRALSKRICYDEPRKTIFHNEGHRLLGQLARALGLGDHDFDLRSEIAGPAASGAVVLHGENIYVAVTQDRGRTVVYRSCKGRHDVQGGPSHFAEAEDLCNTDEFAARITRDLKLKGRLESVR